MPPPTCGQENIKTNTVRSLIWAALTGFCTSQTGMASLFGTTHPDPGDRPKNIQVQASSRLNKETAPHLLGMKTSWQGKIHGICSSQVPAWNPRTNWPASPTSTEFTVAVVAAGARRVEGLFTCPKIVLDQKRTYTPGKIVSTSQEVEVMFWKSDAQAFAFPLEQ